MTSVRGVVRTRGYLCFIVALAVLFSVAALAGTLDPVHGEGGWELPGAAFVFTPLLLAARAMRCAVVVPDDQVIVRNAILTRRLLGVP